ncbi:MAG: Asp-tRNA(Asn)/Glu-tRNA(Gln) amidotransferase subunit GatA [Planctomycetota bacterium]|nr:MAG: Asp-tRNA(Asn)/Glu-tRNA(Gln) amidotransferase subunit GatA [Planctomycetota bacterium]
MSALPAPNAAAWAEAVRRGDLDPLDGVRAALARARQLDPGLNALLHLDAEGAEDAARALRERLRRGEDPGPLAGVPLVVKNNIAVAGWKLTCGSRILGDFASTFTATVVERLRAAGAIPIAASNLDEFAMGASTENSAFGPARNPFRTDLVPGGSSGGSAVSVAAGYAPFALGSETGGSVRQPASFCGLFGLKPTYGCLSRYGLVAFASSLDQIGVFGRGARDLALAFDAAAGRDRADSTTLAEPVEPCVPQLGRGVDGMRVGLLANSFAAGVEDTTQQRVRAAAEALRAAGARLAETQFPYEEAVVPTYYLLNTAEASSNLARFDGIRYGLRAEDARQLRDLYLRSRDAGFGPEVKRRILLGTFSLSAGYYDQYFTAALKARTLVVRAYLDLFRKFDLLLGATTPTPAFRLGEKSDDPVAMYLCDIFTCSANLGGVPAVNVPAGLGADGLPRGVQLTGRHRGEAALLRAAAVLEQALGGCPPLPQAAARALAA